MRILQPTYLIAELRGAVVPFVKAHRARFNPGHVYWPVDITLAGSSGVGTLEEGEELGLIVEKLGPIIRRLYFTDVDFERISSFAGTGIFYLSPKRDKFDRMHVAIAESGVRFDRSDFPYTPHCTLKAGEPSEEDRTFQDLDFPRSASVECFSLYQPRPYGGDRVYRFEPGTGR